MAQHVLFVHGAGSGAYEEDEHLVESLRRALGADFTVHYPALPDEDDAPYAKWKRRIESELASLPAPVVLVGHSVGASTLAKYLSEATPEKAVRGIFLLANPFWGGDGWRYDGYEELELPRDAAAKFPKEAPVFLYHCRDDETVPFEHLALYRKAFPRANVRELDTGGHQFDEDLSTVAADIRTL